MVVEVFAGDVSVLEPLARKWEQECNGVKMGIHLDCETHLKDLQGLVDGTLSDLLILRNGEEIIGYMGLQIIDSPIGNQKTANEHYWYVIPERRGVSSLRLIHAAEAWAQMNKCSHLLMSASYLASDLHDKTCRLYERFGMSPFETTFIKQV
jgi:hypothetical protein